MQLILRRLSDTIGLPDTIEIVRRWGGRTLYVPASVSPNDPLALTLGYNSALRLVEHWGGQYLQLPIERNGLLDLRNKSVIEDYRAGVSKTQIGLRYGLCRQSITHILQMYAEREAIRKKYSGQLIEEAVEQEYCGKQLKLLFDESKEHAA